MEKVPNFQLFSHQKLPIALKQLALILDEIEQKAQVKNTKRATEWSLKVREIVWEKKNYSGSQNSLTDLSEILWKFSAEVKTEKGQALTPSALTGMRAAIHHHLTCAPLSQNINILQDSKFMSANKMLTWLNWMLIYSDMNDILYVYMHQIFRFFYRKTITTTWKLMEVRVACLG